MINNVSLDAYRIKNNPRSITENSSMLNDLIMSSNNDYKKIYYTKLKNKNTDLKTK